MTLAAVAAGALAAASPAPADSGVELNHPPQAVIDGPSAVPSGGPTTFDGDRSRDPDGSISTYDWHAGGCGVEGANARHAVVTCNAPGPRLVTLSVRDNGVLGLGQFQRDGSAAHDVCVAGIAGPGSSDPFGFWGFDVYTDPTWAEPSIAVVPPYGPAPAEAYRSVDFPGACRRYSVRYFFPFQGAFQILAQFPPGAGPSWGSVIIYNGDTQSVQISG
jgi:hypothetical protein